jgi:hypothetical protein
MSLDTRCLSSGSLEQANTKISQPLMRRSSAAQYCNVSVRFLENAAFSGHGPKFVKLSNRLVLYRQADLDDWLTSRTVSSTSEVA